MCAVPGGSRLPVRAVPGASKNRLVGEHDGALKIAVTAVADRGRANRALADFLAELLGIRRADVQIAAGETNRRKEFVCAGLSAEALAAKLRALGVESAVQPPRTGNPTRRIE